MSCQFVSSKTRKRCQKTCDSVYCVMHTFYVKNKLSKKRREPGIRKPKVVSPHCPGTLPIEKTIEILKTIFYEKRKFLTVEKMVCMESIYRNGSRLGRDDFTSVLSAHAYLDRTKPKDYSIDIWNKFWV